MTKYKEKGVTKETPVQEPHDCAVGCGERSVIRQTDGHYYCFDHHMEYCRGKNLEKIKAEFGAKKP